MIKELLEESQKNIDYFFENVNATQFEAILHFCFSCKGLIVCTGVGKSGIIAEKIATTLASTGTKALYLPTLNFLHGDIGILSEGDTVLMLSKSGESEELLTLIPFIHKKKAKIIGLTSQPTSRIAKDSDLSLTLPVKKELCHFDLVPTTSAEVQLIFGDILAIALMKLRNFNLAEYVLNHPSGAIGKKMTLTVKDLMIKEDNIPACRPYDTLGEVLVELTQKKCGALVILGEDQELQGIFTDGDLRRALQKHGSTVLQQTIGNLMTSTAISVDSEILAWDAMQQMQKDTNKWVMVSPVVKDNKVVGLLRMHDIIQAGLT
ncbi:MAG: KpsF/GutQ family sugar-phosphate isomerase [Chlamydiota bacterium]